MHIMVPYGDKIGWGMQHECAAYVQCQRVKGVKHLLQFGRRAALRLCRCFGCGLKEEDGVLRGAAAGWPGRVDEQEDQTVLLS